MAKHNLSVRKYTNEFIALVIDLKLINGYNFEQIAKEVKITPGAVRHIFNKNYLGINYGQTAIVSLQSKMNQPECNEDFPIVATEPKEEGFYIV